MIDVGVSEKKLYGGEPFTTDSKKTRIIYPELRINKDIGDFDIGEKVTFQVTAVVTAMRKDKSTVSTTFEVHEIGTGKKKTRESVGRKLANDFLK